MSNALTMFQEAGRPAHLDTYFHESNIENRSTVNSLSYKGKSWSISINGEKTNLQRKNADGDVEPVTVMKAIVLDYAKRRGRSYYKGNYDPDQEQAPVCWSADGIKPFDNVPEKQHPKCEGCPQSIKGSKVWGDKQGTACAQHRILALIPAFNIGNFPALRLKIAVTSDFDKQSPSAAAAGKDNWFAFQQYTDFLKARGVKHSAEVVTKIKFDPEAAYPKLFFSPDRWLETDEAAKVLPILKDPETTKLLDDTWTPAGPDGTRTDDAPEPVAQPGNGVAGVTSTTTAAPSSAPADDDDGEIILEGLDAPAATPVQEPAQAAVEPAKVDPKPEPAKAAEKAAEAAPEPAKSADPSLDALLADWT